MAFFEGKTHVSPPERAAFQAILDAGFADVVRPHTPGPGTYTYWDYTQLRFPEAAGHADRLRPRLPGARRAGRPARPSTARSARARAPATTRR